MTSPPSGAEWLVVVSDAVPQIALGRLDLQASLPAPCSQVGAAQVDTLRIRHALEACQLQLCEVDPSRPVCSTLASGRPLPGRGAIGAGLLEDGRAASQYARERGRAVIRTLLPLVLAKRGGLIADVYTHIAALRSIVQRLNFEALAAALAATVVPQP